MYNIKTKTAAIYLRFSNDDQASDESISIANQRTICEKFALENRFYKVREFVDDGISGTTFERPAFSEMVNLIKEGEISAVIVKDLSRFGRDYIKVGQYMETFFPEWGVDFIAIADNYDSRKNDNNAEIAIFKNFFNDWYPRDISKKIRAVNDMKVKSGKRTSPNNTPYGYRYCEKTERLVIDSVTSPVVKRIFSMCMGGMGPYQIANTLTEENFLTPREYKVSRKMTAKNEKIKSANVAKNKMWTCRTISKMLQKKEYAGHFVAKETYSLSHKNNKRILLSENEQTVFYNHHEGIISQQIFDTCQNILKTNKRTPKSNKEKSIFSGHVFCATCGKSHNRGGDRYNCGAYRNRGGCSPHSVTRSKLEEEVTKQVLKMIKTVNKDRAGFQKAVSQVKLLEETISFKNKETQILELKKSLEKNETIIATLYEDRALGNLPKERYEILAQNYDIQREEIKRKLGELQDETHPVKNELDNIKHFISLAKKYSGLKKLDSTSLRELTEKIVIHEKVYVEDLTKKNKKRREQKIEVHFNFLSKNLLDKLGF
ncbi:MAG: recombinase family protein [Defluviitaleaceae bacterium]|nr:recombinase family protein [Defluviitaleaceae bacterium]